jgi:hypothetical protein
MKEVMLKQETNALTPIMGKLRNKSITTGIFVSFFITFGSELCP